MAKTPVLCLCRQYDLRAALGDAVGAAPHLEFITPDEVTDPGAIRHVLAFRPLDDAFDTLPNVEVVCSMGAGVDGLLLHPGLRPDMKIVRMMNPDQAKMMAGFAAWHVVEHHRKMSDFKRFQRGGEWRADRLGLGPGHFPVAILGYGAMGQAAGKALAAMGYPVIGWAGSARQVDGVDVLAGDDGLKTVLSDARAIIGLLPLTDETRCIFNATTFAMMRDDAILIQLGRGDHLIETDLLAALGKGRPECAALDVFETEPLPENNPLWDHPKVFITPHIAADNDGPAIVKAIVKTISAHETGADIPGLVDREKGY